VVHSEYSVIGVYFLIAIVTERHVQPWLWRIRSRIDYF
jgi:hypothetical protein